MIPYNINNWYDRAIGFFIFGEGINQITVRDTEISNNRCNYISDDKDSVTFENCTINGNEWKE